MRAIPRLVALSALIGLSHLGLASPAAACSIRRDWLYRPRTYFLATVLAETVPAGPGEMKYIRMPYEPDVDTLPILGQVFRLHRVGGSGDAALSRAVQASAVEAVVVPWGVAPDCRTIRWDGEMPWKAGTTGLFGAALRPESQWVGGRPTFDISWAHTEPYPQSDSRALEAPDPALSAEQLFSLFQVLPTREGAEGVSYGAVRPLLRWAAANPELARRYPADRALESAYETLQPCVSRTETSPVAGTYRLRITPAGGGALELFVRTTARPSAVECRGEVAQRDPGGIAPRPADSYQLMVHGAPAEDSIPETNREAHGTRCSVTGLRVSEPARTLRSGVRIWRADLDWGMLERCFPESGEVKRAVDRYRAMLRSGEASELPGEFRLHPDGRAEFRQVLEADGKVLLSVRGRRIPGGRVLGYR